MTAMGLWHPASGPGAPGPLPASTCPSCMSTVLAEESHLLRDYIDILLLSNKTLLTMDVCPNYININMRSVCIRVSRLIFLYLF